NEFVIVTVLAAWARTVISAANGVIVACGSVAVYAVPVAVPGSVCATVHVAPTGRSVMTAASPPASRKNMGCPGGATCRPSRMQSSSTGKDSPTWAARSLPARALWMCRSAPKYVLVTVTDTGAPSIGTVTSPSAGSNETAPAPAGSGSVTVQTPPPGTVTSKPPPVAGRVTTSPSMTVRSPRVQSTLIRGSDAAYVASPSTCLTTLRV